MPLIDLLKNNSLNWTLTTDQSFLAFKEPMYPTHVLSLLDFTNPFFLQCDASGKGIGAILMQEGRPLDFNRKQISERHLVQSIYEKEMLVILHDVDI
jgi:hypothetical protein